MKLNLKEPTSANTLQAMAFSKGEWAASLQPDTKISIAGTLEINEWQNNRLPQLLVKILLLKVESLSTGALLRLQRSSSC